MENPDRKKRNPNAGKKMLARENGLGEGASGDHER
jgi:hypothetical protein